MHSFETTTEPAEGTCYHNIQCQCITNTSEACLLPKPCGLSNNQLKIKAQGNSGISNADFELVLGGEARDVVVWDPAFKSKSDWFPAKTGKGDYISRTCQLQKNPERYQIIPQTTDETSTSTFTLSDYGYIPNVCMNRSGAKCSLTICTGSDTFEIKFPSDTSNDVWMVDMSGDVGDYIF